VTIDTEAGVGTGRHASWLELFFDLVVVAAILQLAHRLHGEPTLRDIGIFVALYLAVWFAWISFTLYANVAGEKTRRRAMILAMFGIAVMAAAVPEATGERAVVFAVAYVVVRLLGLHTWAATRRTMLAWPSVQFASGIVPWAVSIFTPPPVRYALWGAGLTVDLVLSILVGGWRTRASAPSPAYPLPAARLDLTHLAERLGLFLIIVLGEGVLQLVTAAGQARWTADVITVAVAGFVLLIGLWWPTFSYGITPTEHGRLPVWASMPLHFLGVVSITAVAAGLGALMDHADGHPGPGVRWLLGGGLAAYFVGAVAGTILLRQRVFWLLYWGVPGVAAPVLLAIYGTRLSNPALAWLLVAVVAWQALYVWFDERRIKRRGKRLQVG
jgi:low temperature requirement protein LtrA